jgi:hypothetical protein
MRHLVPSTLHRETAMNTETLNQITNHLECLGYTIEKREPQQEEDKLVFFAAHSTHNNFIYFELMPNFIFFQVGLNCEKNQSPEMHSYINQFNTISNLVRSYSIPLQNGRALVRLEANYIGEYSKELFSQFYDLLEADQKRFTSLKDFEKVFI